MFNPGAFENSRPEGFSVLEIVDGEEPGEPRPRRFVPLQRTELGGEVAGPLAALRLRQVFRFSRQQCDKVIEAVYRFPLPGDAAVTGVRVRFGEVEIQAALKERQKAETDYKEAKQQGRQAALLTRESPDVFTLQVAGIQPDQDVTVETSYVQLARAEGPGWNLRVPLTTSPRYVRPDEADSRHAQGQPLLLLRDPGHRFALDLTLVGAGTVSSPTHELEQTREGDRVRIRLHGGEVLPDRDCVLSWRPAQEEERPVLQVQLHDDPANQEVYFLALLAPPRRRPAGQGVPREVVLLVDHSGSMEGAKWEAADWAVKRFLTELTGRDRFALGLFHDRTHWLGKTPQAADEKAVKKAVAFLEKNHDSGGTNLGVALEQALELPRGTGEAARHVLILTDAEVTDAGRVLRLADQEARAAERRRIDVLCIDAAPNSFLAHELAERGGGVARFLTSAPEEEDITTALDEVLADWAQPVVAGLRLEINCPGVEAAGRALLPAPADRSAIDLGDLPAGRSLWVAGRLPRGNGAELAFRVLTPEGREVAGCRVRPGKERHDRPALKPLFGARRVLGLEFLTTAGYDEDELRDRLKRLGYDPKEVLADQPTKKAKVYAENAGKDAREMLHRLLVREALTYGLASSETAFVAVRTEAGKPVEETVAVANALPAGWSDRFLGGALGGFASGTVVACLAAPAAPAPQAFRSMAVDPAEAVDSCLAEFDDATYGMQPSADTLRPMIQPALGVRPRVSFAAAPPPIPGQKALFSGVPRFEKGEALLFDSGRDQEAQLLPEETTLSRLQVEFPGGAPKAESLNADLALLLFVEDMAMPRARVRLADLMRQGGARPLNLRRRAGQRVRLVLADPSGAWAGAAPALQVMVSWA